VHYHPGKILGMIVYSHQGAHIEGTAIFARASEDVNGRIKRGTRTHSHSYASLASCPVNDEFPPSGSVSVIEKTAEHTQLVDSIGLETSRIHDKGLVDIFRLCKSPSILEGHSNHPIFAAHGVEQGRDTIE
jgi:hypothetical protein